MRKIITILALLMITVLCAAVASADSEGYRVDLPDEIYADQNGYISAPYGIPSGGKPIRISCSDPSAFRSQGTGHTSTGPFFYFQMTAIGEYTLHFTSESGFSKDVRVIVEKPATAVHLEQDTIYMEVGQTVPFRYTTEGGSLHNPLQKYNTGALSFDLWADPMTLTGLKTGRYTVELSRGLGSFQVYVTDPCENVQISCADERCAVGNYYPLTITDGDGKPVFVRTEITEGTECATLHTVGSTVSVRALQPGWFTVTAYGSDGSTASVRRQIPNAPQSMEVNLRSDTLAAGESMQVTVELPEDTWAPVSFGLWDPAPAQAGLTGPVAKISEDGLLTGLTAGSCWLQVKCNELSQMIPITVTDSDLGLQFDIPDPAFDWRSNFQLAVHTKSGKPVPAVFSGAGPNIHVSEDGLLTADQTNAYGTVTAELEGGLSYRFSVCSRSFPAWLEPEAEVITMPIDIISAPMFEVTSDVPITLSQDLVICSGDESVLKVEHHRLVPQAIGTALVTVWSRYNDVSCSVLVAVTEPEGRLFMNGEPDNSSIFIACDTTEALPTLTDCDGNPVNVTWTVTHESITSGNPVGHVITLEDNSRIRCVWSDGAAELHAAAANGVTFKLTVWPYNRGTKCSFRENEYTVATGSFVQADFIYNYGGNTGTLQTKDVTFTITGDTDCVSVEPHFSYHTFTGLREGTVTLTATMYNGYTASTVIHVITPDGCKDGHDPQWETVHEPTAISHGVRALQCSRCHVPLGEVEEIPCTGTLSFAQDEIWLIAGTDDDSAALGAKLDGDSKQSFTYRSSDRAVAECLGDFVIGLRPGTATITLIKGDCEPAECTVHVLTVLTLPTELTAIEEYAFEGVMASRVVIPSSVTEIGDYAFANCRYLTEVIVPDSVTSIGEHAFAGSPHVTVICRPESYAAKWAAGHNTPWAEK